MAKIKNRNYLLAIEEHVALEVRPSISLFCPLLKCKGTRDIAYCLYKCSRARLTKCPEYQRVYPALLNFEIDPKYLEKYGDPVIPLPYGLRKRRKRRGISVSED